MATINERPEEITIAETIILLGILVLLILGVMRLIAYTNEKDPRVKWCEKNGGMMMGNIVGCQFPPK